MSQKELETDNKLAEENEDHEDYNEEDDEDFVPGQVNSNEAGESDEEDEDAEIGENEAIKSKNYSKIESETGGLIKTRRGRQLEKEHFAKHKYDNIMVGTASLSEKAQSIWDEMQNESTKRLHDKKSARHSVISDEIPDSSDSSKDPNDNNAVEEEMITIERTYKFAGEIIHEKKQAPISSAVAKEYLNSLKFDANKTQGSNDTSKTSNENSNNKATTEDDKPKLRRPLKRPPILEEIISGALKPKLSTLEKSKLDWVQYVDKEGISDELQYNKKDGYLAKQDFLSRVESVKDDQYKELRQKQLAMQFRAQQQQNSR